MRALFVYTAKVFTCCGKHYTNNLPSAIWKDRYRKIFDEVLVFARNVTVERCNETLSDYDNVSFHLTTLGINKKELILKNKLIYAEIEKLVKQVDVVICRMGFFGVLAAECARKNNKPYVCEVVGSSWDDLWNYSLAGKVGALWLQPRVRREVKRSPFTVYVTNDYLQKEYPCNGKTIGISNVILKKPDEDVLIRRLDRIRSHENNKVFTLGTAAAIDVPYKGQKFVIDALSRLKKRGIYCFYHLAGNGNQKPLLEYAASKGVEDQIVFLGALPHEKMREFYEALDIYLQPSLQEGLPRAVIEAMGSALPVIGFKTAGIPELIEGRFVCKKKSVGGIVKRIEMLVSSQSMMEKAASRNFEKSFDYEKDLLEKKWLNFYEEAVVLKKTV